jgi:hypothetical protein
MLELMGSKNLQENLEVVSETADHKFNVFRIQPSRFYTFLGRFLFRSIFH